MSDVAIRVEGLSKQYRIGQGRAPYKTIRESLTDALVSPFRRLWANPQSAIRNPQSGSAPFRRLKVTDHKTTDNTTTDQSPVVSGPVVSSQSSRSPADWIWALKDVSFEVKQGEVIGIIGRNGAGKSTLLKILSRITKPTEGRAVVSGRVGSLLEVGTGFHPELTGRENIYLNGAILGMKKAELDCKFDEVVAFAEVEKFIDTPVKHYSSGMYVRLAFSVAAHLDPEILLVDEVLAVGDTSFQKKCLGRMDDVAKEGRTILLVSHNMGAITRLCPRTIWLDEGRVESYGHTGAIVAQYLSAHVTAQADLSATNSPRSSRHISFCLRAARVKDHHGVVNSCLDVRFPFTIEIEYELLQLMKGLSSVPMRGFSVGFRLMTPEGVVAFSSADTDQEELRGSVRSPGIYISRCIIPAELLNKGQYVVSVGINTPDGSDDIFMEGVLSFQVEPTGGILSAIPDNRIGVICPKLSWSLQKI